MTLVDLNPVVERSFAISASPSLLDLHARIASREAIVAVVGLGYVGIPLAVAYAEAGFRVVGVDSNVQRVQTMREGRSPVEDISDARLTPITAQVSALYTNRPRDVEAPGFLAVTSDFDLLSLADAVVICVPTPLSNTKDPDLSFILAVTDEIAQRLRPGVLVVLESTTYPGTTEELILPMLEHPEDSRHRRSGDNHRTTRSPLVVGRDFFLAFSPERIDPGRTDYGVANTPKVVGGVTGACLQVATELYSAIVERVVPVSRPKAAELVKLLENTFRSVNIALVNELAMWCDRLEVDVWEVIDAAATKPFGFMPFRPGPGLGGHCIPVDPKYLAWKLRVLDFPAQFIELAAEINASMPRHVMEKVSQALNDDSKAVRNSNVLVLGVAYKPNVSDVRESPALDLVRLLLKGGANVHFNDPHVPEICVDGTVLRSVPLDESLLREADCVVIETDHAEFDWNHIVRHARTIVDTRNATAAVSGRTRARIVKL